MSKNRGRKFMKKLRFIFLALLFFLARPESAMASDGTWQGKQYLKADGSQAGNEWVFDAHYQSWFYIKADANYAENEWLKQGDDYFYLKSGGYMAKSEWVEDKGVLYYLDQDGKMKRNAWLGASYVGATGAKVIEDWVYDSQYDAWFYIKADGQHAEKEWLQIKGKDYYFKSGGYLLTSQWIEQAYVSASGAKVQQGWLFDKQYQSWFYIKENGNHADKEWIFENGHYYYLKSGGYMAANEWILDKESWFYLKSDGKMAEKEWVYDSKNQAWYYFKSGGYMAKNETIDGHQLGNDGKWHKESKISSDYYQVLPVTANIYNADGEKLSYISQGSVVWLDKDRKSDDKRLAITISGLSGYMKTEDLQALDASKDFEKIKTQNKLRPQHIQKIVDTYRDRKEIEKYSHLATLEEIAENDYNLNIPRYVDTFEEEEPIDIHAVMKEIKDLEAKRADLDKEIEGYLKELGIM